MRATLLLVAMALVLAPTMLAPEASAHPVCVGPGCNCPPENPGTHVHVDTSPLDACIDA